jgi:NTE family protein
VIRRVLADLPRPTAWVFTSGGARAAAQVGMAEVLLEQGYAPDRLVGSSFGAINAAALLRAGADLGLLREAWRQIGADSLFESPGAAAVRGFAPRTGRPGRELRGIFARALGDQADRPVPAELTLVASDLDSGVPVVLSDCSVLDAVVASCTIPVLLPPVEIGGRLVLDGGLTAAAPVEQALAAGAASIVLLDCGASAVPEEVLAGMRWWQVAALSYNHQIRSQLQHSISRVAARIPVVVVSADSGSILDFGDPDEQFRAGRSAAAGALARDLARDLADGTIAAPGIHGSLADDPSR